MNKNNMFDAHASTYDSWFFENTNLLESEVKLVAHFLKDAGEIYSVGCGSGLFESILKKDYGIDIKYGLEPSEGMAEIARKRGVQVEITTAENVELGVEKYDTILFNGTPSYITDLKGVVQKAYKALKKGGKIVMIDVPKESSYGILYNLAASLDTWDHPMLKQVHPVNPYPIEFVKIANWRSTEEKIQILKNCRLKNFEYAQTLTKHPIYSNDVLEEPIEGYDSGSYVAICAVK